MVYKGKDQDKIRHELMQFSDCFFVWSFTKRAPVILNGIGPMFGKGYVLPLVYFRKIKLKNKEFRMKLLIRFGEFLTESYSKIVGAPR